MKNIVLSNRYGLKTWLEPVSDNTYKLLQEPSSYYRIIGNSDDIQAIDPEGGPFLSIGTIIDNKKITKIMSDCTFILEDVN